MTGNKGWTAGLTGLTTLYIFFYALPVLTFLMISFFESAGPAVVGDRLTLANYQTFISDPYYQQLLLRTLWLSAVTAIATVVIALGMAWVIAHSRSRWAALLFLLVIASMFTSFIVGALGLRLLLSEVGPLSSLLAGVGLPRLGIASSEAAVVIGMTHACLPLAVIALIPACDAIDRDQLDASLGLGASRLRTFLWVILPRTSFALIGVGLLVFSICTGLFVTPLLLGGGRVGMVAIEIRQQILGLLEYPMGATLATVLVIVVTLAVAAGLLVARRAAPPGSWT